MIKSLDIWRETGKDFEVRITTDPRFIAKSDLIEITNILHDRNVANIAIQKYIPHFEDENNKTDSASREQFFNDRDLRERR